MTRDGLDAYYEKVSKMLSESQRCKSAENSKKLYESIERKETLYLDRSFVAKEQIDKNRTSFRSQENARK